MVIRQFRIVLMGSPHPKARGAASQERCAAGAKL
jgi:hypothetical protein